MCNEQLKGTLGCLVFSFYVIVCSADDWLMHGSNRNKEGYNRAPWSFGFFLHLKQALVWVESVASWGCRHRCLLGTRCTHLPYPCFESCWTPTRSESTGILCSWGMANSACKRSGKDQGHAHFPLSAQVPISHWTSLTKHKLKGKIIKNPRWQPQGIKTIMRTFWAFCTGHMPTESARVGMRVPA